MATAFVNKHMTRTLAAGATNHDTTWIANVDAWLTSQDLHRYLVAWTNPAFGVIKNGSNHISKIFDLGTTWLSRLGDYTPANPTGTTYAATGLNGTTPAWVNAAATDYGYYGSARNNTMRFNNIRRKHHQGLTLVAAYQKSHAFATTFLAMGSQGGFYLQNTDGSPGNAKILIGRWGNAWLINSTSTSTIANSAAHIIGGTFDGTTVQVFVEGVAAGTAGGPATQDNTPLYGQSNNNSQPFLNSGSLNSAVIVATNDAAVTRTWEGSSAVFSASDLIIFDTDLSGAQMASLNALLRGRIGA